MKCNLITWSSSKEMAQVKQADQKKQADQVEMLG
jgi:hypothetical protein